MKGLGHGQPPLIAPAARWQAGTRAPLRSSALFWLATTIVAATACAPQHSAAPAAPAAETTVPNWKGLDAPADTRLPLFSGRGLAGATSQFSIRGAVSLPDGSVALSYDLRAEAAGGDNVESDGPQIAILQADGTLTSLALPPELDGISVPPMLCR